MVSKELLEAVLDRKILTFEIVGRKNSKYIQYFTGYTEYHKHSINIHELAHKCKELAFNSGNSMHTMYDLVIKTKNRIAYTVDIVCDCGDGSIVKTIYWNNEPEAIFKACEWILKEIKKKNE